ncbi:MAG: OmpA family protein [Bacteroidetes bacterium]|nr:OmpA family protein [Bacteroidota bacterium]
MKKLLLISLLLFTGFYRSSAQLNFGVAHSNFSGTQGMYLNPAAIADSRHRLAFELYSVSFLANNNQAKFDFNRLFKDARSSDSLKLGNYLRSLSGTNLNMILPYAEVRGPSLFYSIDRRNTIGLNTRVRLLNQFEDFNGDVFNAVLHGLTNSGNSFSVNNSTPYYWTSHLVTDLGLSYGVVLMDKGKDFVKAGITAKFYRGNAFLNMSGTSLDGTYYSDGDSLVVNDADFTMSSNLTDEKANQLRNFGTVSNFFDQFFGKSAGTGFGGDVGVIYEYRPDHESYYYDMDNETHIYDREVNKYKFKASLSVLDIGKVRYKDVQSIHVTGSGTITNVNEVHFNNYSELNDNFTSFGLTVDSVTGQTVDVKLPTTLVAGVDYKFINHVYGNLTYMQGVVTDMKVPGNYYYNQVTLTPRYESKRYDIGVPVSYNMMSEDVKVGFGARVAFFTIGSDDLLGYFGSNSKGFNVYFGIRANINFKKPKDSDGDKVSDKLDSCIFEKGVWAYKGCPIPDKDGDGILDPDDLCPDLAGLKSARGCPDRDLDSIADASDNCPDVYGMLKFNGCPDTDGDDVPDMNDSCPNIKGEPRYNGCPDTDGDGLSDNLDKCPDKAGPVANEGCPDTDNDGIADNLDRCPEKAGPRSNNGCPEISVEVKKRLAFAATAIQFDFAKATIKKGSFKLLDEIVAILNEYSDYNMTIFGHTDNIGTDSTNMKLSRDRANSVREYFISKGITTDRLTSDGFGESQPVATNKTSAGRAKNRRVDMDLKLK